MNKDAIVEEMINYIMTIESDQQTARYVTGNQKDVVALIIKKLDSEVEHEN